MVPVAEPALKLPKAPGWFSVPGLPPAGHNRVGVSVTPSATDSRPKLGTAWPAASTAVTVAEKADPAGKNADPAAETGAGLRPGMAMAVVAQSPAL